LISFVLFYALVLHKHIILYFGVRVLSLYTFLLYLMQIDYSVQTGSPPT